MVGVNFKYVYLYLNITSKLQIKPKYTRNGTPYLKVDAKDIVAVILSPDPPATSHVT